MNGTVLKGAVLLGLLAPVPTRCAEPPSGEWNNTDLRGLQEAPPACLRLWFEERTYRLVPEKGRLTGLYGNVIRSLPVGPPSYNPDCKFPAPASKMVSSQMRSWAVVGTPNSGGGWRIRAQAGPGGGDALGFKTDDFETALTRAGEHLIDATGSADDANQALVFRPPGRPPAAAREVLERAVQRLNSGACLEVMAPISPSQEATAQLCDIRRRLAQFTGAYVSLSVDFETPFDRVPDTFPGGPASGWKRQPGVFFTFTGQYEKQKIPGNAIVYEKEGRWSLAFLWF